MGLPNENCTLTGQTCMFDISKQHFAGQDFFFQNHKKRRDVIHFKRFLDFPSSIKEKKFEHD
jgi:hypothetical protein